MKKKLVLLFFVLILVGGGFFNWWQNQKDIRELNKTLPAGVKVVKSLIGNGYKVVNKIDGYEFKAPKEWKGINIIEYIPERTESGYTAASISMIGEEEIQRSITVDQFKIKNAKNIELKSWAETNFKTFELVGSFEEGQVERFEIVKTQENVHLGGMYVYFFQNSSAIYAITGSLEDSIRYIIANGKW